MKRSLFPLVLVGLALATTPAALASGFPSSEPVISRPLFIYPAQGILTSGYGWRWGRLHKGIDIAAPIGTPIRAAASGTVTFAGWNEGGYGNLVEVQHGNGSLTRYAHNSEILARRGQTVERGDVIALMGSTGRSTGSHCHFEIHLPKRGAVNPLALISSADKPVLHGQDSQGR